MSGNTIGTLFSVTTFGESHGVALGCVVDGCPPGMALSEADIQPDVDRRRSGNSHFTSQRREADLVRILSGVFEGRTTGTPIGLLIENTDQRSRDYEKIKDRFRPGHADYTYQQKYGFRDYRGGGRSSARETVCASRQVRSLASTCVSASAYASTDTWRAWVPSSWRRRIRPARTRTRSSVPTRSRVPELEAFVWKLLEQGDSIGAQVTVIARGVPPGLGEPVFGRLDADIAGAMMGINAVKGVEIGAGFGAVEQRGSEHRDELTPDGFRSNHAGGVLGGISSGPGPHGQHRPQAHLQHPHSGQDDRRAGAARWRFRPPAGTTPAWDCAPLRSPRRCWRSC